MARNKAWKIITRMEMELMIKWYYPDGLQAAVGFYRVGGVGYYNKEEREASLRFCLSLRETKR